MINYQEIQLTTYKYATKHQHNNSYVAAHNKLFSFFKSLTIFSKFVFFKEVNKEVLRHTTLPTQIVDTHVICLFSFVRDSKKETSSDGPKMVK